MPMVQDPRWAAINLDGTPCSGANLTVYNSGTDVISSIYYDEAMTVRAPNPLVADGRGYFPTFYAKNGGYKIKITAPNGAVISQVDKITI